MMAASASSLLQLKNKYDRIPTSIYEDNYGYTINFYQPMIDYLDAKQRGTNPQYPHLPWSNERGLKKFWSSKSVRSYTPDDINKYSKEVYEHAKNRQRDLEDYKIIKRTPLAVSKSAVGARLNRHLSAYSNIEKKYQRKLQEREDERRCAAIMEDIELIKAKFNTNKDIVISPSLKNAIRGKTANQISAAILAESEKNIKVARNEEDLLICHAKAQLHGTSHAKIIKRTAHIEFIDDRLIDNLDTSVSSSLHDVKQQLHSFNQRTSDFYQDSRWRNRKYY